MRTRTLLMLSVVTALLILAAGGVFLLQLSQTDEPVEAAQIGDDVRVGDMVVTVVSATETGDGTFVVPIDVGGVDDQDGVDSFRLVTGDRQLEPVRTGDDVCAAFTVAEQRCDLVFDVSSVESSSRLLVARRGDQQRSWALTDP